MSDPGVTAQPTIILIGCPNSGKTTLFNWLTGLRHKTVNYPGSTVQYVTGKSLAIDGRQVQVIDTPGTYSLHSHGLEEEVTTNILEETLKLGRFHVVLILDSTRLSKNMNLFIQLHQAGIPFSVALTMTDTIIAEGKSIDVDHLSQLIGVKVFLVDGRLGAGTKEIISGTFSHAQAQASLNIDFKSFVQFLPAQAEVERWRNIFLSSMRIDPSSPVARKTARERTAKLDQWLLHPIWGLVTFVMVMFLTFSSIFWFATPFMDFIDGAFSSVGAWIVEHLGNNLVSSLIANGIFAGAGAVFVFVPQIAILFIGLTLLEDSGYLARAATLVDRPLQALGLSGRSFVPLLSGYACAIPAMMAARAVGGVRTRLLTLFIIPLMSCSARLPVYALLLALLFHDNPWKAGLFLTGVYLASAIVASITSAIVARFVGEKEPSIFMLDLPLYRRPSYRTVLATTFARTKSYIQRAGPAIFLFSLIIWVATTFPNYQLSESARLESSFAGQFGKVIEPVLAPMGADWRMGVGLISAFAAREVFVSSLAIVFHATESGDGQSDLQLLSSLQSATRFDGTPLFNVGSILALIVFFMIALQCMSTFAVARSEFGAWKWPLIQLIAFNSLAYCLAVFVYQVWLHT